MIALIGNKSGEWRQRDEMRSFRKKFQDNNPARVRNPLAWETKGIIRSRPILIMGVAAESGAVDWMP